MAGGSTLLLTGRYDIHMSRRLPSYCVNGTAATTSISYAARRHINDIKYMC